MGENVVVGVGVKVFGNINIGSNVCIGVSFVVLRDVFFDCIVVGIFGRVVYCFGVKVNFLEYGSLFDFEVIVICVLLNKIDFFEE